jgi:hypothetical protein
MSRQKVRVKGTGKHVHTVDSFGEFKHEIAGETFEFVITMDLSGIGHNVTHKASGMRVCTIDDGDRETLLQRALNCLSRLVQRSGDERVRSVIAGSRPLPAIKYLAGWNVPGCMPEEPFAEFDTFNEAREHIVNEIEKLIDDLLVGDCPVTAAQATKALEWIKNESEPFTIGPIDRYVYEITRA